MHITHLSIANIPPFTSQVEFELNPQVNIFVGRNASGKSTLLRQLATKSPVGADFDFGLSDDWQHSDHLRRSRVRRRQRPYPSRSRSEPTASWSDDIQEKADHLPWVYIPAVRHNLPLSHDREAMHNLQVSSWDKRPDVDYPPNLLNVTRILSDSMYLFDGNSIRQACKAITDLFRMGRDSDIEFLRKQTAKTAAYKCAQQICSDILIEGSEPSDYVHNQPLRTGAFTVTNVYDDMAVDTKDISGDDIFAGDLSSGTQSTLLWIWHLALKIADFYEYETNWPRLPAILLVDEIENNLHPTWQRRVIPALLENFPRLQIFAATHSPFIVAGRDAGQVHKLERDDRQIISGETFTEQNIVGWTSDEILRTLMDVDDPTDQTTAIYSEELRKLSAQIPLTDPEAERLRQQRMQELRPLVDPDLLAGGPMARRREEFAKRFAEVMENRRRSGAPDRGNQ